MRLLRPQHWCKYINLQTGLSASYTGNEHTVTLHWNNKQHQNTIHIDPRTNVFTMHMAHDTQRYNKYSQMFDQKHNKKILCHHTETKDNNNKLKHDKQFLLTLHLRYNHIPFKRIQHMAKLGYIPKRLATIPLPICKACLYDRSTKRKWQHKTPTQGHKWIRPATTPGEVISTDQLISPTPGLISQMTGTPTNKRYTCATVYVDHHSDYTHLHLKQSTNAEETTKGKCAFEHMSQTQGINILHYHSDNGIFISNKWRQSCEDKQQGLSFSGVNTHHQNGIAENRIRLLQELTRSSINHSRHEWQHAISYNLWPYTMRMACEVLNNTPSRKHNFTKTPQQVYFNTNTAPNTSHW